MTRRSHLRFGKALGVATAVSLLAGCSGGNAASERTTETPEVAQTAVAQGSSDVPLSEPISAPRALEVQSAEFADGAPIPPANSFSGFGCTGENQSPSVSWSGAPADTKSYALIVHDPDAPTGVGFFHWVVYDIPAGTTSLPQNAATSLPRGAHSGHNDFGTTSYGGPCPPPGSPHRYVFTVYALGVPTLGITDPPTGALLRFMLAQHTLAYGRLVGTFQR